MKINVNKDLTKFKREKVNGNTVEENFKLFISIGVVFIIAALLFFLLHIPLLLSVLIVMPLGLILSLILFFNIDGMSFTEWLEVSKRYRKQEPLYHQSIAYKEFNDLFADTINKKTLYVDKTKSKDKKKTEKPGKETRKERILRKKEVKERVKQEIKRQIEQPVVEKEPIQEIKKEIIVPIEELDTKEIVIEENDTLDLKVNDKAKKKHKITFAFVSNCLFALILAVAISYFGSFYFLKFYEEYKYNQINKLEQKIEKY